MISPGIHFFLSRVMSRVQFPSLSRTWNIGLRVGVHQACMMPFIQFALLFASAALQPAPTVQARVAAGKNRFNEKWKTGFTASLMYWPVVNTLMYSMVHPRFMNLYADMASLIFAAIMSHITHKRCDSQAIPALEPQLRADSLPASLSLNKALSAPISSSKLSDTVAAITNLLRQTQAISFVTIGSLAEA